MISKEEILKNHLNGYGLFDKTEESSPIKTDIMNAMEEYHQAKVKENELLHNVRLSF